MENIDAMLDTLREFDELGVQLSIDDFWHRLLQLAYLRHLPIGELENRPLVCQRPGNRPARRADCRGHLAMAHPLGLSAGGRRRGKPTPSLPSWRPRVAGYARLVAGQIHAGCRAGALDG